MDVAEQAGRVWTAEEFLATDQRAFGLSWRYELVKGRIVAHAAPSPDHGAIIANLVGTLYNKLRGHPSGCRAEVGSGAAPQQQQRPTARVTDVTIRCGEHPRVAFEVVSPSELRDWRGRDEKRRDLQDVDGVQEIIEIYQGQAAIHVYRRGADASWRFEMIGGLGVSLRLASVDLMIPLAEIYEGIETDAQTAD